MRMRLASLVLKDRKRAVLEHRACQCSRRTPHSLLDRLRLNQMQWRENELPSVYQVLGKSALGNRYGPTSFWTLRAQSASVIPFLAISWQHGQHAHLTFVSPQAQPQASIVNLASQILRLTLEKNGLLEALEHEKQKNAKLRSAQRSRQKV